jgi:hypothetical protein
MLAKLTIQTSGDITPSFLPCLINRHSQPEVLGHDTRGERVVSYVNDITREAGLQARFAWHGDEVAILPA